MVQLSKDYSPFDSSSKPTHLIGAKLFDPDVTSEIKRSVLTSSALGKTICKIASTDTSEPLSKHKLKEMKLRRRACVILDGLAADVSRQWKLRIIAFALDSLLVRMYQQGVFIKEAEFLEVLRIIDHFADSAVACW